MTADRKGIGRIVVVAVVLAAAIWLIHSSLKDDEPQGVVLIILDTMRADHLPCYGYERDTAPVLTRLAEEGVLFENAVSFAPWTLPSMVNLLSSRYPTSRDVFDGKLRQSIVSTLEEAGFSTGAVTEGGWVTRHHGFDLGFSEYIEEEGEEPAGPDGSKPQLVAVGHIENTFREARKWIDRHRSEKFFLMIHTYEPHTPYRRKAFTKGLDPGKVGDTFEMEKLPLLQKGELVFDEVDLEYLESLYDGGILESDRHVGAFLDHLDEIGLREKTVVVVTSDHGEEMGEHYPAFAADHGHSLRDDQLRVPLILHNPCEKYPSRRITHQVRLMDVMPTVAELLGVPLERPATGSSLVPMMRGTEEVGRASFGGATKAGPARSYVRYLGFKYIETIGRQSREAPMIPPPPRIQLYDMEADPGETTNLAGQKPDIVGQMQKVLLELGQGDQGGRDFIIPEVEDETLRRRLKSLGYLR